MSCSGSTGFPPISGLWHTLKLRYGHFTLGVTELLYHWAREGHELPILQMMEHIQNQLTKWFDERRNQGVSWSSSYLVPSAEKLISEALADSHCYQVLRANNVEFEIVSSERTNVVNINTRCSSCRHWQLYGIPCAHAVAALLSSGEDIYHHADDCFTVNKYCETYSQAIYLIPDRSLWNGLADRMQGAWRPQS